ncbi:MAG: pilus assembly protein PilP [Nitrospiraceae bacterium]
MLLVLGVSIYAVGLSHSVSMAQGSPGRPSDAGNTGAAPGNPNSASALAVQVPSSGPKAVSPDPSGLSLRDPGGYFYSPGGRRDPFAALSERGSGDLSEEELPPLQRATLTELNLIGIMWGGFGYVAMVQTPDGKGYTVTRGTRIGPNKGVVRAVTDKAIVVEEQFTDIYGKKQVREFVKPLHAEEGSK